MVGQTTVEQYPLEKRKIIKKTLNDYIGIVIFIVILIPLHSFFWDKFHLFLIIADILLLIDIILQPIYQYYYYKKYFYDVEEKFLVIKKGVITSREVTLDYDKIQDVYMDQDLLDRAFSLWDVHVSTATSLSGIAAHIDGVNVENAQIIKQEILARIKKGKK